MRILLAVMMLVLLVAPSAGAQTMTVLDSIEAALANNLDYRRQDATYAISSAEEKRTRAGLYPTLTANGSTITGTRATIYGTESTTLSISQPFYSGGRLSNEVLASQSRRESSFQDLRQSGLTVEERVVTEYLNHVHQQVFLRIVNSAIDRARGQLRLVETRVKEGSRDPSAISRWQVLIDDFQNQLITGRNAMEDIESRFNSLLGRRCSTPVELRHVGAREFEHDYLLLAELRKSLTSCQVVDCLMEYAVECSPLYQRAEAEIAAARYDIRAENGKRAPQVDLTVDYGQQAGSSVIPYNTWAGGFRMAFPLYNQRNLEDVRVRDLRLQKVIIDREVYLRDLALNLRRLYLRLLASADQVALRRSQAILAKEYLHSLIARYSEGKADDVQLIDAYDAYYRNQYARARALYDYYISRQALVSAAGWSFVEQNLPAMMYVSRRQKNLPIPERPAEDVRAAFGKVESDDLPGLKAMLSGKPSLLDGRDGVGKTLLHTAARTGSLEMMRELIDRGSDVNARDVSGYTPLHEAALAGRAKAVRELIFRAADVRAVSSGCGVSPLDMAAASGDRATVLALLESGGRLDGRSSAGWTPLHFAADAGSLDAVKLLVERGADVNARTAAGLRPVQTAWEGRFNDIVTYLQTFDRKPLYDIDADDVSPDASAGSGSGKLLR